MRPNGKTLIVNARLVNEGQVAEGDLRIDNGRIVSVARELSATAGETVVDADGRWLLPGLIDDQVHFREPGLTHKADIASESRAAVAGGVTSYMEMPNVRPPTIDMDRHEEKMAIAARVSPANYGFYLGATVDNLAALRTADPNRIAGIKIFMGASTGDLLVDDDKALEAIFTAAPTLIATHCEDNRRIAERQAHYGKTAGAEQHPLIRDTEVCYNASAKAVALARRTGARLHVLHITTKKELDLFAAGHAPDKMITAEACAHHLLFDDSDYATLGMRLKCNPAVKTADDRRALRTAVADGRIDVLATDHAPHLPAEKDLPYAQAAAGLPLVEYALPAFLQLVADGDLSFAAVARAGAHRVADLFQITDRGYLREGCFADLALVEETPEGESGVRPAVLSKCGWTPFAGMKFHYRVRQTWVNGHCVWKDGRLVDAPYGQPLQFNRRPNRQ